jgi:triacylglycerol lipase
MTEFSPQNALFFARVCRAAYFPDDGPIQDAFGGGLLGLERFDGPLDSHGFVARAQGLAVLAFRGTFPLSIDNWLTDADAPLGPAPDSAPGQVHRGFADAFSGLAATVDQFLAGLDDGLDLWVTGHSLGGALATLASVHLAGRPSFCGVYTFGSPRVGDAEYAGVYKADHFRVVNDNDIVPRVPPKDLSYHHVGTRVLLVPGQDPQVSATGDDPDGSALGGEVAGRIAAFLQAGSLDPLLALEGLSAGVAGPLGVAAEGSRQLRDRLLGASFAVVEGWADAVCQRAPTSCATTSRSATSGPWVGLTSRRRPDVVGGPRRARTACSRIWRRSDDKGTRNEPSAYRPACLRQDHRHSPACRAAV